jgi:hypothetical protein
LLAVLAVRELFPEFWGRAEPAGRAAFLRSALPARGAGLALASSAEQGSGLDQFPAEVSADSLTLRNRLALTTDRTVQAPVH